MYDVFALLSQRSVIIALAFLGALLATIASFMPEPPQGPEKAVPRILGRVGYIITGVSIVLFIAAGFLSDQ